MADLTRIPTGIVGPTGRPLDIITSDAQNWHLDVGETFAALSAGNTKMQAEAAIEIARVQAQGGVAAERERARPALWLAVAAPVMFVVVVVAIVAAPADRAPALAGLGAAALALIGVRLWKSPAPK